MSIIVLSLKSFSFLSIIFPSLFRNLFFLPYHLFILSTSSTWLKQLLSLSPNNFQLLSIIFSSITIVYSKIYSSYPTTCVLFHLLHAPRYRGNYNFFYDSLSNSTDKKRFALYRTPSR